jgi:transcription initiation factor TFIIE subunit alpha
LDYGEFADVAKYRIAMMRKAIDEKIKNEVGQRGYLCQRCGRTYSPLEISNTFDPSSNAFLCELCGTELIEDDPSLHGDETGGQDRMQRFNQATAAVRDALKSIEGARLPVLNIRAWIAQNVKSDVPVEAAGTDESARVNIVMGEEDDSEAKRKLADAQREQNALPTWHLTSTVTGEKTTLGLKEDALARAQAEANRGGPKTDTRDEDDALLAAHYANLEDGGDDDFDDETEEPPTTGPTAVASAEPTPAATGTQTPDVPVPAEEEATSAVPDVMVFVAGVAKRLADVTDADEDLMTPDEYEVSLSFRD